MSREKKNKTVGAEPLTTKEQPMQAGSSTGVPVGETPPSRQHWTTNKEGSQTSESGYISEEERKLEEVREAERVCDEELDRVDQAQLANDNDNAAVETGNSMQASSSDGQPKADLAEDTTETNDVNYETGILSAPTDSQITADSNKTETVQVKESESLPEDDAEVVVFVGSPIKQSSKSPKLGGGVVLRNKSLLNSVLAPPPAKFRESQDDPACPARFTLAPTDNNATTEPVWSQLLDLSYRMFSRQWRLVTATRVEASNESLLLFHHDPRILPVIGQQQLAALSVDTRTGDGGGVRLHNLTADKTTALCKQLELVPREDLPNVYMPQDCERMYSQLVFSFGKHSFSLFNNIQTRFGCLVMFRSSNLVSTSPLSLSLGYGNTIQLRGAAGDEVNTIRDVISSRWPYPIHVDAHIAQLRVENTTITNGSSPASPANSSSASVDDAPTEQMDWEWKVRRYPWRVSYGARLVDRAVERVCRLLPLPSPKHQDLESAKSIIIFSIKELSERGWKFSGAMSTAEQIFIQFIK